MLKILFFFFVLISLEKIRVFEKMLNLNLIKISMYFLNAKFLMDMIYDFVVRWVTTLVRDEFEKLFSLIMENVIS